MTASSIPQKQAVFLKAQEIYSSLALAIEWLYSPIPVLQNSKPIDLIETAEGCEEVLKTLRRIESGDYCA